MSEKNNNEKEIKSYVFTKETFGITLLLFSGVVLIMLLTRNLVFAGIGTAVCTFMYGVFGYGSYLVLFLLGYLGVYLAFGKKIKISFLKALTISLTVLMLFLLVHTITSNTISVQSFGDYVSGCYSRAAEGWSGYTFGGVISAVIVYPVVNLTTFIGAYVIFSVLALLCAYLTVLVFRRAIRNSRGSDITAETQTPEITETDTATYVPEPEPEPEPEPDPVVRPQPQPVYNTEQPQPQTPEQQPDYWSVPIDEVKGEEEQPFDSKKILFGKGEFEVESYRRNRIFNEDSYFNHPVTNGADDYLNGFSDGTKKSSAATFGKSYQEAYKEDVASDASTYTPTNYVYGEKPVEKITDNEPVNGISYSELTEKDTSDDIDDNYINPYSEAAPVEYHENPAPDRTETDRTEFIPAEDDVREEIRPIENGFNPYGGETDRPIRRNEFTGDDFEIYNENKIEPVQPVDEELGRTELPRDTERRFTDERRSENNVNEERGRTELPLDTERRFTDEMRSENNVNEERGRTELPRDTERRFTDERRSENNVNEERGRTELPRDTERRFTDERRSENNVNEERGRTELPRDTERRTDSGRNFFDDDDGDENILGFSPRQDISEPERTDVDRTEISGRAERISDNAEPDFTERRTVLPENKEEEGVRQPVKRYEDKPVMQPAEPEPKPAPPEKPKHVWKKYVRPPITLLDDYPENNNVNTSEIEENKRIIVETLEKFKIASHISNVVVGPAITRYDVIIEDKTNIKRAMSFRDSIAMSLMKENVNTYLNYAKGAISIEVPNSNRTIVGLKGLIVSPKFINSKQNSLTFGLGKSIDGEIVCPDITKMPHLLVAGTTGSGKSICLSALLISLLYRYGPDELRLILVDPKQVEFVPYDKLPHLMINEILHDAGTAIKALKWANDEMDRRYTLFRNMTEAGTVTKNLDEYNKNLPEGEEKLPKILIILDEFGDLMLQSKKEVERLIIKLVQKARACGIHLILATQRPSVDCITGLIKSNLPTRIGFKVNSFDDSRTIFDIGGAEKLLGKGDLYFRSSDSPDLQRIQCSFVDTHEVQKVTDFVRANNETYFDQSVSDYINTVESEEESVDEGGGKEVPEESESKIDETYVKALKYCINSNQASVSMIQRRFPVGYIKACKMIDWMQGMNYITPSEGSKPRKVLMTMDEFIETYGDIDD